MNQIEWVNDVVGKPWVDRAEGPDSFDCWGLVVDSYRRIESAEITPVDGYQSSELIEKLGNTERDSGRWSESGHYKQGEVFCVYNAAGSMIHVGRIIRVHRAGFYGVHAGIRESGQVKANSMASLERKHGNKIKYYRRVA
jgi:hypothetical protein